MPYQRVSTRQPYVYVIGPVGYPLGHPGAKQTVMDVHGALREGHPGWNDHLIAMGHAVWLALNRTTDEAQAGPPPEGFTFRLVRLTPADYNRLIAQANAQEVRDARVIASHRIRDPMHVRYVRKAPVVPGDEDVWSLTTWGEVTRDINLSEAPWPAPDPFRDQPARAADGQHRLDRPGA